MENQNREEFIYTLCIKDIQTVAELEIERKLSIEEINQIKDLIAEKIDWYGVIANSISERIELVV